MVFSSIPAYLDPSNWQQQHNHHALGASTSTNPLLQPAPQHTPLPPPPLPASQPHAPGGTGSIRPGSMAERARLANIPMPETALKCPRCESTNTKFCYFNNYSLTQPRHFCKTCRRYWTKGGALRNVPVGGGCRRNKRSKSSTSSKSPVSGDRQTNTSNSTSTISSNSTGGVQTNSLLGLSPQIPPLRFMSPLSQLTDNYNTPGEIGLNYGGISAPMVGGNNDTNFSIGSGLLGGGVASLLSSGGIEQWRMQQMQQFPFLGGLDSSSSPVGPGLYQFHQGGGVEQSSFLGETSTHHQVRPKLSTSVLSQLAAVKVEDGNNNNNNTASANNDNQELNLSRQLLGMSGNEQWNGAANWTDLSSFSSSSTSNPL